MAQFKRDDQYFIILEILLRPRWSYGGHLVVELRQGGVGREVGRVTLEQLQLFVKPVFILFAAVPAAAHRAEQDLTGLAPPLKDHHLEGIERSTLSTNTRLLKTLTACRKKYLIHFHKKTCFEDAHH